MPPETWQGAEPSRSAVKRWQRRRQRRRRARNLPPRPQPPGDAAEPPEKVCKLPAGAARTPGHLAGGQAGGGGSRPRGCRACCCRLSRRAAPAAGARARGGRVALGGRSALAPGAAARERRGSLRRLLRPPPASLALSRARWHHHLFPAAAPNDSCRCRRGGAVAVPGGGPCTADSPRHRLNFSRSS